MGYGPWNLKPRVWVHKNFKGFVVVKHSDHISKNIGHHFEFIRVESSLSLRNRATALVRLENSLGGELSGAECHHDPR